MSTPTRLIRNFSIIAHIDHGKSTLADRLLDATGALTERERKAQLLDNMDLERERGITIKAATVRLEYEAADGQTYELNLIDTPGHVDFHYEVSRSLAACEGAVLVVDASQGVEAQTLANVYLAVNNNLTIVPVINKIDLPAADPENVRRQIEEVIGIDASEAILASAKEGKGIHEILEAVVAKVPPPVGDVDGAAEGADVRQLVRHLPRRRHPGARRRRRPAPEAEGALHGRAPRVRGADHRRVRAASRARCPSSAAGEVGFFTAAIKEVADARVGDTITDAANPAAEPLPGFQARQADGVRRHLPDRLGALRPTCATRWTSCGSTTRRSRASPRRRRRWASASAAASWACCTWRSSRSGWSANTTWTSSPRRRPCVSAACSRTATIIELDNPAKFPSEGDIDRIEEPIIAVTIHTPPEYVGGILKLCEEQRGMQTGLTYAGEKRVIIRYDLPLTEMVFGFYDRLKTCSRGYASLDYEPKDYRAADLVRMDMLVNGDRVDSLSLIVHREGSYNKGRDLCVKMKELIPQQQFEVAIQASIGSRVIARTTVKAMRKNVTAKCYGGDITPQAQVAGAAEGR